ncbi:MarR family winged helix-turn-helix transcriptional regulator [Nocardioides alkalitolerans]|uniref:MarR family winged helix-turn-helix transcriptional regulator n=1 Tax=Nocardioides alkalitolerans TaxID=281714 RepID=UPI0004063AAB|nr:MarR family winged helix-turn-helix transcriptional regulator [Nocardioides alkalitolerans]
MSPDADQPADQPGDLDAALAALGSEVMRIASRRSASYAGSVLDQSAFRILWRLVEMGPRTLAELTDDLLLERSTVSRQVSAAERRGLVHRDTEPGPGGRPVAATPDGVAAYRHDVELRAVVWRRAVAELGHEPTAELADTLRLFNDALDRAHDEARVTD